MFEGGGKELLDFAYAGKLIKTLKNYSLVTIKTFLTFLPCSLESVGPLLLPFMFFPALLELTISLAWLAASLAFSFKTLMLRLAFECKRG